MKTINYTHPIRHKETVDYCKAIVGEGSVYSWSLKGGRKIETNSPEFRGMPAEPMEIIIQEINHKVFFNYNLTKEIPVQK